MRRTPLTTRRTLVFDSSPTSGATRVLAGVKIPSSVEAQRSYYSQAAQIAAPSAASITGAAKDAAGHIQQAINVAKSAAADALSPPLRLVASVRPAQNAIQRLLAQTPNTATRLPASGLTASANNVANLATQLVRDKVGSNITAIAAGIQKAKTPALIALGAAAVAGIAYAGYRFYKWLRSGSTVAGKPAPASPTPQLGEAPQATTTEEGESRYTAEPDLPAPEPITYQDLHSIARDAAAEYAKNKGLHSPPAGKIIQLTQGLQALLETSQDPATFVERAINYVNTELESSYT